MVDTVSKPQNLLWLNIGIVAISSKCCTWLWRNFDLYQTIEIQPHCNSKYSFPFFIPFKVDSVETFENIAKFHTGALHLKILIWWPAIPPLCFLRNSHIRGIIGLEKTVAPRPDHTVCLLLLFLFVYMFNNVSFILECNKYPPFKKFSILSYQSFIFILVIFWIFKRILEEIPCCCFLCFI